jgi:hypothetical protein
MEFTMRQRWVILFALLAAAAALGTSCSIMRKKSEKEAESAPPPREHLLKKIIPYTLRVRRPAGPGADPQAGPGGTDYYGSPRPDAKLDCQTPEWLFREIELSQLQTCLSTIKDARQERYRLKRVATPYLELDPSSGTPDCLKKALPVIPVPREIFFQSNVEGPLYCYSSRLAIEANETAGFRLPTHRLAVRVDLPAGKMLQDEDKLRLLLLSWALAPFWEGGHQAIPAHIVTDQLCTACLGEKTMLKPTDPEPVLWP